MKRFLSMHKTFSYRRIANFYETDAAQIVHFSNYFRYMEEAELEFIASFSQIDCSKEMWVRNNLLCDYRAPIRFNEEFRVELVVVAASLDEISYEFCIYIEDTVSAKGSYTVKSFSFSNEINDFCCEEINEQLINAING